MGDADDTSESKTRVAVIYHRSKICGKTRCLPKEMILEIFLRLPAKVLHDVMRHVCREWSLMISSQAFIYHHLRNSTPGIMIQDWCLFGNAVYIKLQPGGLETCRFDIGFRGLVLSCCNGLALVANSFRDRHARYVVINPLTKEWTILHPFPGRVEYDAKFGLGFAQASMEYKVVCAVDDEQLFLRTKIAVITLGVDKVWRHIDVEHPPLATRRPLIHPPLVTGGYIHWTEGTFVLTLNVETETTRLFPKPLLPEKRTNFLPMDGNLSILSESKEFLWDVWEMNSETGEWTISLSFDLSPVRDRLDHVFRNTKSIRPFGWLVVREFLVFSTTNFQKRCFIYNIKTGEILLFELDKNPYYRHFKPHVHSLVRLQREF